MKYVLPATSLVIGFCLAPSFVVAGEFSYVPSERRRFPIEQYVKPGTPATAPATVQEPEIQPLPRNAYSYETRRESYSGLALDIKAGVRRDNLNWSIASEMTGTATPNILSELTWENVDTFQIEPRLSYTHPTGWMKGFHIEGSVVQGSSFAGENQDSDYFGDNRTAEFSRSNNDADSGETGGYSVGLGYAFSFTDNREKTLARFMALVGYAVQEQTFAMTNGNQTVATFGITPPLGPFAGLDSTYEAKWSAPFVGASVEAFFFEFHRLQLRGKYYKGDYQGEANWNLRSDFAHPVSFRHDADGQGFAVGVEYGWEFYPRAEFTLSADYLQFEADPGLDTTFFSNGSVLTTRLNEVEWDSQQYMAGFGYKF